MGRLTEEANRLFTDLSYALTRALVLDRPLARIARVRERALRRWTRRHRKGL